MIQIIWGLLNISILIYFIIICFKATKVIREKLGIFATLVLVFGLISFIKPSTEDLKSKTFNLQKLQAEKSEFQGNTYLTELLLEDNLASQIRLTIIHGKNETGKTILQTSSSRNGFVSGTNWKVETIDIDKSNIDNNYNYIVSGLLEWKILGIRIYSEAKHFKGKTELKD